MTSIRTSIINKISKNQNQNQEAQEVKPEKESNYQGFIVKIKIIYIIIFVL